jgi:hypothetical protein
MKIKSGITCNPFNGELTSTTKTNLSFYSLAKPMIGTWKNSNYLMQSLPIISKRQSLGRLQQEKGST